MLQQNNVSLKGTAKKTDLNELVGMLWHTAGHRTLSYYAEWVPSGANLADAPSRHDCRVLKQIGGREIQLDFRGFLEPLKHGAHE